MEKRFQTLHSGSVPSTLRGLPAGAPSAVSKPFIAGQCLQPLLYFQPRQMGAQFPNPS